MKVERKLVSESRCSGREPSHGPVSDATCCWWHRVGGLCINALCPHDEPKQVSSRYATVAAGMVVLFVTLSVGVLAGALVVRAVQAILG